MLMRTAIILVFFVLALAVLQSGHLDDLRRVAESVTPSGWNPDATLLGLYTMIVMGVSSGSTRARVALDLSTVKQERIDELAEAFNEINALAYEKVAQRLNAVRAVMGATVLTAQDAGTAAASLSSKLALLSSTAEAHDGDEVRASIEKLRALSAVLVDAATIPVPDVEEVLDQLDDQLKVVGKMIGQYDFDDTVQEIENVKLLGKELGALARMFSGEPEPEAKAT
jgi:hypothetical protein